MSFYMQFDNAGLTVSSSHYLTHSRDLVVQLSLDCFRKRSSEKMSISLYCRAGRAALLSFDADIKVSLLSSQKEQLETDHTAEFNLFLSSCTLALLTKQVAFVP